MKVNFEILFIILCVLFLVFSMGLVNKNWQDLNKEIEVCNEH